VPPLGRRIARLGLLAAGAGLAAATRAQPVADAVDVALAWARGSYRAPLVCSFDGEPRRGLRRVAIARGPRDSTRRVNRLTFFDLDAGAAQRCVSELGGDEPNLVGSLDLGYSPRRPHSDTPERDFAVERRRGPIEYEIVRGGLRMGPVQEPVEALRWVDFTGGRARLGEVRRGSDAARVLADLPGRRQLELELEAPGGTRIVMPLAAGAR
jgi:hypothetical protein